MVDVPSLEIQAIAELSKIPQWVLWRVDTRNGKPTKVPCTPHGSTARVDDPSTWSTFAACIDAAMNGSVRHRFAGVGFVLTFTDPFVAIDLDGCLDEAGNTLPWASEIVQTVDSYTERSPSGKGLHIFARGELPPGRRRRGPVEMYDSGRFLTVTGAVFGGRETIEARKDEIARIHSEQLMRGATQPGPADTDCAFDITSTAQPPAAKFAALLANDSKFKRSWDHRRQDLADQSLSSYDLSLASIAAGAGWTDAEIAALIASHRRMHGDARKGQRVDYLARTIETARASRAEGLDDSRADLHAYRGTSMTEDTSEAIAQVAAQWHAPLVGLRRIGDEAPVYYLLFDGSKEIRVGSTEDLLSQSRVRARILEATLGVVIPRFKSDRWDAHIGLLVAHAETVDPDEASEIDSTQQTLGWIDEYLSDTPAGKREDAMMEMNQPVIADDGSVLVHSGELSHWIWVRRGERFSQRELALRLRASGLMLHRIWFGPENKRRSRRYWKYIAKMTPAPLHRMFSETLGVK